jgi:hypothetical protein
MIFLSEHTFENPDIFLLMYLCNFSPSEFEIVTCITMKFLLYNSTGLTKIGCQVEVMVTSPHLANCIPFQESALVKSAPCTVGCGA